MEKIGFDSQKYLSMQRSKIKERIDMFGGKLYLEFGGKLFDDFHASRVLPGFVPDNKLVVLQELKDIAEIVIVINAEDIAKNKLRADLGITYDADVLRLVEIFRSKGLYVGSIVLSQYSEDNKSAIIFQQKVEKMGIKVYHHYYIEGYPSNIAHIVSDEGYGKNEYIETTKQLVVVTAPGPGSGKMATCLSQIYHDYKRGIHAGYAKYETFPIWNLELNHPVNIAYEAATADLNDANMIDPWHLQAYNKIAINYNRDIEIFPVLNALFEKLMGQSPYKSPTDMGVNMAGYGISNDEVCQEASKQEVVRRYYKALVAQRQFVGSSAEVEKIQLLMERLGIGKEYRKVANTAHHLVEQTDVPVAVIELNDGSLVSGKRSNLMTASTAMLINAIKKLANIDDDIKLISPLIIEPILRVRKEFFGDSSPHLHCDEVLMALAMNAVTSDTANKALKQIESLKGCEVHSSVILSPQDENVFRKLGLNVTCDPIYSTKPTDAKY